jgi:hypothetical protein
MIGSADWSESFTRLALRSENVSLKVSALVIERFGTAVLSKLAKLCPATFSINPI